MWCHLFIVIALSAFVTGESSDGFFNHRIMCYSSSKYDDSSGVKHNFVLNILWNNKHPSHLAFLYKEGDMEMVVKTPIFNAEDKKGRWPVDNKQTLHLVGKIKINSRKSASSAKNTEVELYLNWKEKKGYVIFDNVIGEYSYPRQFIIHHVIKGP